MNRATSARKLKCTLAAISATEIVTCEPTQMRNGLLLSMFLCFLGCARFQDVAAPRPQPGAALQPAPEAMGALPASFECSDGTIASSLETCQANMAQARLPPSQQIESAPIKPVGATSPPR